MSVMSVRVVGVERGNRVFGSVDNITVNALRCTACSRVALHNASALPTTVTHVLTTVTCAGAQLQRQWQCVS